MKWLPIAFATICVFQVGCGLTEPEESCQTGGHGVYGCALVRGVVSDSSGNPLRFYSVLPRYLDGRGCGDTPIEVTDKEGKYALRLRFHCPSPGMLELADTMTIYVRASRGAVGGRDSVLAKINIGDWPETVVNFLLPTQSGEG